MFKSEGRRKRRGFGPLTIFRLILSLVMFLILGLAAYQAFKYFSGETTPSPELILKDPKAALISIVTSEDSAKVLFGLLGFDLKGKQNSSDKADSTTALSKPPSSQPKNQPKKTSSKLLFKFGVASDSHNDNENLGKGLELLKSKGAKLVILLGDFGDTGSIAELQAAKKVLDGAGLPYYATAGDHDLWEAREKGLPAESNFAKVFGSPYQSFIDSNIRFVIVYNSDNYLGVDPVQMDWLEGVLSEESNTNKTGTFVFLHEPLKHPTSDRVMGKTTPKLLTQAQRLINIFDEAGVLGAFSGDIHAYSRYEDEKSGLKMTTVGAVTAVRNLQLPRVLMVDVYDDGSYNVEDLEIGQ